MSVRKRRENCNASCRKILEQKVFCLVMKMYKLYFGDGGSTISIHGEFVDSWWNDNTSRSGSHAKAKVTEIMKTKFTAKIKF